MSKIDEIKKSKMPLNSSDLGIKELNDKIDLFINEVSLQLQNLENKLDEYLKKLTN